MLTAKLNTKELTVRELTRDDLNVLQKPRTKSDIPKTMRDSHHRIARFIASGLRPGEVAVRSGYSRERLNVIEASPAFQELVAHYRQKVDERWLESTDDYYDLAQGNMLKAERQISDKLDEADENNELLPTRDLIAISRDAADRFGYGKHQTNTNVNVDFADQLEKAIARSGKVLSPPARTLPVNRANSGAQMPPLRRRA